MAHPPAPRPDGVRDYRALLAHALSDGRIVGDEARQLAVLAARAGLTQTTARQVHEEFLAEARARAEADGTVTARELRELQRAAKELAATYLISDLEAAAAATRARTNGPLKGWRILPLGESPHLTAVVDYAVEHGAKVAVNLTKTVRLVIADATAGRPPYRQGTRRRRRRGVPRAGAEDPRRGDRQSAAAALQRPHRSPDRRRVGRRTRRGNPAYSP